MKSIAAVLLALASTGASAQCANPFGWVLVGSRQMSLQETICVYERDGIRVQIVVPFFCPISPC